MKNSDPVPLQEQNNSDETSKISVDSEKKRDKDKSDKKKKKRNLWPLKAMAITLFLSFAVNAGSELVLSGAQWWIASILTCVILALGVVFDMIGTAATACDVEPFLAMASRKVKGAKTAVRLSKNSHVVSSVCCDIVGDICGIVSGICAAAIFVSLTNSFVGELSGIGAFFVKVGISAVVSTATITLKAVGKALAVNKSNKIIFGVAKFLSIFRKEG
ncbi:MAG: hypothetical protein NC099_02430 [Corallococcus sp.]|nr:hypothetical protein [Bacillota bacterium]MCM1533489.1 hypothetical protein [Corallococcus sp.]